MAEAAELGTKKVMDEHCSIGIVVTTDGSITDIPREDYLAAERRAIADMKATGKPFLVIVNSREPGSDRAKAIREELTAEYILPKAFDPRVGAAVAAAVEEAARRTGVAKI